MTDSLAFALIGMSLVYALTTSVSSSKTMASVRRVSSLRPPRPAVWPRVSVIIAARDEEETIGSALRSRLSEQYPDAEYIVVDDRSTDRTGQIIDAIAVTDPRVRPVHLDSLTPGWLGKVNAMNEGLRLATGDYVLFSDADVHHAPHTLATIIAHCEDKGIDHVAVIPTLWSSTFGLDVFMNVFVRFLLTIVRGWRVADPESRASVGGGNFCLVRRSALERIDGGLAALRLEIGDDVALGQMLKWSGARQALLSARGHVSLAFYRGLPEAIRGFEKNSFAVAGFSVVRQSALLAALLLVELGVFAGLALATSHDLLVLGGVTLAVTVARDLAVARWAGRPTLASLLWPLGVLVLVWSGLRSMVMTLARGGVEWRGTWYSLASLRAGRRLRIT